VVAIDGAGARVIGRNRERGVVVVALEQAFEVGGAALHVFGGIERVGNAAALRVPGINCMSPWAPATLMAEGLPADSAMITARTRPCGTALLAEASVTSV